MTRARKRSRTDGTDDFLEAPIYRLVDRHLAILEKIRTREDAEYWGHMLIGEFYPRIPSSRSASGKLAALVGLSSYMDFYCARGYYELLKEGKTLEEARKILAERTASGMRKLTGVLGIPERQVARKANAGQAPEASEGVKTKNPHSEP